jgi:hypothetical protein
VVDQALGGNRRADALVDESDDLEVATTVVDRGRHPVTDADGTRGLGCHSVDPHVTTPARRRCCRARLVDPDRPHPSVDPRRVHDEHRAMPAAPGTCRTGVPELAAQASDARYLVWRPPGGKRRAVNPTPAVAQEDAVAEQTTTERSDARRRAEEVAGSAQGEAAAVAGDAREQAAAVASEVSHQAQNLVAEAKHAVEGQAREQTDRLAGTIEGFGEKLQALAHGDADQAGEMGNYVDELGQRLTGVGERLEARGIDGMVDDVQRFARRRPGMFLVSAAAAGFLAGRLVRGQRDAADGQAGQGNGSEAGATAPIAPAAPASRYGTPSYTEAPATPPPGATQPSATEPVPPVPPTPGRPR